MILLRVIAFFVGAALVLWTLISAIRTFVLPRSANDPLTGLVFRLLRRLYSLRLRGARTYLEQDRILALFAPVGLLTVLGVWLALILIGYTCIFWAIPEPIGEPAYELSGSSLFTLGFAQVTTLQTNILAYSEAVIGLVTVALLISYLPTMYTAFSRRETAVTMLEVRAGSPPSAVEMIRRFQALGRLGQLVDLWEVWEVWFVDIEESHTSLAALAFFRSPQPDRCWVTAAGAVLDAASLMASAIDLPREPQTELTIRAGYVALRHVADFFRITHSPDPKPTDPISIAREEFDAACDALAAAGVPLRSDRAQAWRDFAGWRVNYDQVLLGLCTLVTAPEAPWSSDRASKRLNGAGARR